MPVYDTTTVIIPAVKARCFVPTSQGTFQTSDFLRYLNEELQGTVAPLLMGVREEYFVASADTALTAGTASYSINTRAMGMDLRDVLLVDSSGNTTNLTRLEPEEVVGDNSATGRPTSFYLQANNLIVRPTPQTGTTDSLRQSFHQRPNWLVSTASAATVVSIASNVVTVNAVPSTLTTSTPLDFVKGTPGFDSLAVNKTPSAKTSNSLTFAVGAVPSSLAAGDYICLAQESPVAQIPVELYPVLEVATAAAILQAIGDTQRLENAQRELEKKTQGALVLVANRVKGENRKIPSGLFRWRGVGW